MSASKRNHHNIIKYKCLASAIYFNEMAGVKKNKMKNLTAGVIQLDVKPGDLESNLESAQKGLEDLKASGAGLAVLPEMWTWGFDLQNLKSNACGTPAILDKLSRTAARLGMVIAGSMPELFESRIFNTLFVFDRDGKLKGSYRKIHLFSPTEEDKYFCPGNQPVVCSTSVGKLGLLICYDLRFPELCRTLALNEAEIIIVSAQWPAARIKHWDILIQARAVENQIFVVAANNCGKEGHTVFSGRSSIVSPLGTILAKAGGDPAVLSADLNRMEMDKFRTDIPCFQDMRSMGSNLYS